VDTEKEKDEWVFALNTVIKGFYGVQNILIEGELYISKGKLLIKYVRWEIIWIL